MYINIKNSTKNSKIKIVSSSHPVERERRNIPVDLGRNRSLSVVFISYKIIYYSTI